MLRRVTILCFSLLLCVASLAPAAEGKVPADVQFRHAYDVLEKADVARDNSRTTDAIGLYKSALDCYSVLARRYPDWQPGMVGFRIAYCNDQLRALTRWLGRPKGVGVDRAVNRLLSPPDQLRALGLLPGEQANPTDLETIIETATRLLVSGEAGRARVILLQGLRLDPDHVTTRVLLGVAQCMAKNFGDAVFLLQQLVEDVPDNPHAHVTLATAFFGLGRVADAAREMEKALKLAPDLSEAHFNMAQILLRRTPPDHDGARRHYRKSIDLGGAPEDALELVLE